jgi:hypothetical protein
MIECGSVVLRNECLKLETEGPLMLDLPGLGLIRECIAVDAIHMTMSILLGRHLDILIIPRYRSNSVVAGHGDA